MRQPALGHLSLSPSSRPPVHGLPVPSCSWPGRDNPHTVVPDGERHEESSTRARHPERYVALLVP